MLFLVLSAIFIASSGGTQLETDSCDSADLNVCIELIPKTPVGLPRNKNELDAHCKAYHIGMRCMDAWIRKCLPTDGQKILQQQIGGARALMRFLCTNETALRRDFLQEHKCWNVVSPNWSRCVNELQEDVREITNRSKQLTYFYSNGELCCARDAFVMCVADAARVCSTGGSTLLRRMAWVLAQDVAACNYQPRARCAASAPSFSIPLFTALSYLIYPPIF
ncbi:uncharacterized protein LOC114245633 [Bombyx mandarina]|uniref:Uncharacterized protein n=2 Tax=Bombyx TaxID=7090 RepID=A0A8R2HPL6_BOMMO|nr:uncharacterized protein LOC105842492 [Bombyx mori]XP_028033678.1 uncharacterized protein LOC114245633 [Bombyx mandarina]